MLNDPELRRRLSGIHVTLVTPFDRSFSVDYGALRTIVDFVIDRGVKFIDAPLTTGESGSLSLEEHEKVIETAVEQARGRAVVYAGVVRASTLESVSLARFSQEVGTDGVTSHPPYAFKLGESEIYEHFRMVAEATSLPMVIYLSSYAESRVGLSLETMHGLAQLPQLLGFFPTTSDVAELYSYFSALSDSLLLIGGKEELMLFARPLRLDAQSVSTSNFAPAIPQGIWEAVQAGDDQLAAERYSKLHAWRRLVHRKVSQGYPGAFAVYTKATMEMLGLPGGVARPPLQPLSATELEELRQVVFGPLQLTRY